jgi:hypothetical protein
MVIYQFIKTALTKHQAVKTIVGNCERLPSPKTAPRIHNEQNAMLSTRGLEKDSEMTVVTARTVEEQKMKNRFN